MFSKSGGLVPVIFMSWIIWGTSGTALLNGKTIEIEDEDVVAVTPTPVVKAVPKAPTRSDELVEPTKAGKPQPSSQTSKEASAPVRAAATGPRVRMDDKIGFHYFVKSGYVVQEGSDVASVGRVEEYDFDPTYTFPKKCRLSLSEAGASTKIGDRLLVYRVRQRFNESRSGFTGYWVQNVAVLKVLETGEQGTLAQVLESFDPILVGDQLKTYDQELDRWNGARVKKPLPAESVHCFVAGGDFIHDQFSQSEFIVLTAGADQGVVEGQDFQLRDKKKTNDEEEALGKPVGLARVFFAGPGYSMARIVWNYEPVYKSFEARYEP